MQHQELARHLSVDPAGNSGDMVRNSNQARLDFSPASIFGKEMGADLFSKAAVFSEK